MRLLSAEEFGKGFTENGPLNWVVCDVGLRLGELGGKELVFNSEGIT